MQYEEHLVMIQKWENNHLMNIFPSFEDEVLVHFFLKEQIVIKKINNDQ